MQPGTDVAAARDGGEVIGIAEEMDGGQPLQDAEIEGSAANTAAGQADAKERFREFGVGGRGAKQLRAALLQNGPLCLAELIGVPRRKRDFSHGDSRNRSAKAKRKLEG